MATIRFENNNGKECHLDNGSDISEACKTKGNIPFGCCKGVCGTCMVWIISGENNLSAPNDKEIEFFGCVELKRRLSCQVKIMNDKVIII